MAERPQHQPAAVEYIACDLAYDETLTDYRKRCGRSRRRWWKVARGSSRMR